MSPKDEDELNSEENKNPDDNGGKESSEDDFGLGDDMSFEPIDRDQPEASSEEESTTEDQSSQEEPVIEETTEEDKPKPAFDKSKYEQKSKAPLITGLLVAALILGGPSFRGRQPKWGIWPSAIAARLAAVWCMPTRRRNGP